MIIYVVLSVFKLQNNAIFKNAFKHQCAVLLFAAFLMDIQCRGRQ